ncbi:MAG: orotidine-5-phosphate decarboxylase [Patescibacteria group bacterium]|nr:orotidine-5-phosphate decarboxylase [Patescibacteria group bacterium]
MKDNLFKTPKDKLIIAIDNVASLGEIEDLIKETYLFCGWYKIGLEVSTAYGIDTMINLVKKYKAKVFFDGKFHDIPNTVGHATAKLVQKNVDMMTVHCSAGARALERAVENKGDTCILGVTVLTSHTEEDCLHIFGSPVNEKVYQFAEDALNSKMDGIVCSPNELLMLCMDPQFNDLIKITPGIQPDWTVTNDQNRTMTPKDAILNGATAIVVGRGITQQKDRAEAAQLVLQQIIDAMLIAK